MNGLSNYFGNMFKNTNTPGVGTYGTNENQFGDTVGVDKNAFYSIENAGLTPGQNLTKNMGWTDTVKDWFAPQGQIGTAVGIGSGLAGMYYANKKAKLDEERARMEKDVYNRGVQRDKENEIRMQQLAKNAGNNAFYK